LPLGVVTLSRFGLFSDNLLKGFALFKVRDKESSFLLTFDFFKVSFKLLTII